MAGGRIYTKYKNVIEELGLKQLDVYRVIKDGKITDVLRIQDPMSSKILLFDLGAPREALSLLEFLERLRRALVESGIEVSERRLQLLREKLKRLDEARAREEKKEEKKEKEAEAEEKQEAKAGEESMESKASEA